MRCSSYYVKLITSVAMARSDQEVSQ
jgi:hypothetical protein